MNAVDWAVLLGTLVGIAAYGVWRTRHVRSLSTYMRGDAAIGWGTIGLSVMATQASAITFLSIPGQGFESGIGFVQNYFGLPLALIIVCAVFLPMFSRVDLSVMQDLFADVGGRRHGGQIRLDIFNFGNLINSDWGVSDRLVRNQLLTNPAVDAQGRATYRLAVVNSELLTRSYEKVASTSDVWSLMVSFRYTFQ